MTDRNSHAHHHVVDKLIVINAFVSGISLLPEAISVMKNQQATEMSQVTLFIILINSIVWFIYGLHCGIRSLLLSSFLTVLISGFLLIFQ